MPHRVAEDDLPQVRRVGRERASQRRCDTEQGEEVRRGGDAREPEGSVRGRQREGAVVEQREALERRGFAAPLEGRIDRHRVDRNGARWESGVHCELHEAVRLGIGQWTQEHRVHDRKDGRRRGDPQRQGDDGSGRERRAPDEQDQPVPHIAAGIGEELSQVTHGEAV
jgi:hypothetical protein